MVPASSEEEAVENRISADRDKRVARIPRRALKTLVDLEGLQLNPLSPLARVKFPAGEAQREEMIAQVESMGGPWEWAVPALVDPGRTIALLFADEDRALVGQYLFPDPDGSGPGFKAGVTADGLELSGPWTMGDIRMALLDPLSPDIIAESPPARLDLTRPQFWALAAFVDAYRTSRLARNILRLGGRPEGLSASEVAEAWRNGIAIRNPAWSVSMLSLLVPDEYPRGFEGEIPGILADLLRADLLREVSGESGGSHCAPCGDLERLCLELSTSHAVFGLVLRRLQGPRRVEMSTIYGWRSAEGIWLVDLGGAGEGEASILQVGPYLFTEFIAGLLKAGREETAPAAFRMETPYARDRVLAMLRESAAAKTTEGTCPHCGAGLAAEARFCRSCGKRLGAAGEVKAREAETPPRPSYCSRCGQRLPTGAKFCRECGREV